MLKCGIVLLMCAYFGSCLKCTQNDKDLKLIIDNDAGGDDAMAIFLALLFDKYQDGPSLVGLTTTNGNTKESNVFRNNQRVLNIAKRNDIPIYRGSTKSLVITPTSTNFYGQDGLGDANVTLNGDLVPAQETKAVTALIEASKTYQGKLVVITLGSVTNVALAISIDPEFLGRLKHLYVAAGHLHSEKYPNREFNAGMDVEAYHIIAESATPDKVTVFPYSQAIETVSFTKEWRMNVLGGIDTDIMKAQNEFEKISIERYEFWHALDPATVAIALCPDLVKTKKYYKNHIQLCGAERGKNGNSESSKPNVGLIYAVKTKEYQEFLLELFSEANNTIDN